MKLGLVVFLMAYSLGLLIAWPAQQAWSLVAPRLTGVLPESFAIAQISGTVWRGSAQGMQVNQQDLGAVQWHWRPLGLIRGRIAFAVDVQGVGHHVQGQVGLSWQGWQLIDLGGHMEASRLPELLDWPFLLEGQLLPDDLSITLGYDDRVRAAQGRLLWAAAGAGLPRPLPLGDYHLDSFAEAGRWYADISSDPQSPLQVSGQIGWRPILFYHLDLNLRTQPAAAPLLTSALSALGPVQADGSVRWQQAHPEF